MTSIQQWVRSAARHVLSDRVRFVSSHLDEIDSSYVGADDMAEGRLALIACIEELNAAAFAGLTVRLAVPLGVSSKLLLGPPSIPTGRANLGAIHEPPSLYLCRDDGSMYIPHFEEYRLPLQHEMYRPKSGRVLTWYACQRSVDERADGGEFSMVLWFDYLRMN